MGFLYQILEEKNGGRAAEITGYEGEVRRLQIPEKTDGLPVRRIGSHAFAFRKDIREAVVPSSVEALGSFCFYACPELKRLSLCDSVRDYHDGVIRSCRNLHEITINFHETGFRLLKDILADVMTEMDVQITLPEGEEAVLTFPEYHNEDREDTRARAIHSRIIGAGYHYREMVSRKEIDFRGYDQLFRKAEAECSPSAGRIALNRLYRPYELREDACGQYREYLSLHQREILKDLVQDRDRERIQVLLEEVTFTDEIVWEAAEEARKSEQSELLAVLLEYYREHFGNKKKMTDDSMELSLEDF